MGRGLHTLLLSAIVLTATPRFTAAQISDVDDVGPPRLPTPAAPPPDVLAPALPPLEI